MGSSHKHEGLQLIATTTLADADIARLAKEAAAESGHSPMQWSSVRLESVEPGSLGFSVRGPGGLVESLTFSVRASTDGGPTQVRSTITSYKQSQPMFAGFIPIGSKRMLGLAAYRKWLCNFSAALRQVDPAAQVDVHGRLTAGVGDWL